MKKGQKIFVILLLFVIAFFGSTYIGLSTYDSTHNFFIWLMFIYLITATGILIYFYKKPRDILIYLISLFLAYLVFGYLYTLPFISIKLWHNVAFGPTEFLFMTNHFYIYGNSSDFILYNGTHYIPLNITLYEPIYKWYPFITRVPNMINKTIILKISSGFGGCNSYNIEAKYKIIKEEMIQNFNPYDPYYHSLIPVYVLQIKPETNSTEIINLNNMTTNQFIEIGKNIMSCPDNAYYNGIRIT